MSDDMKKETKFQASQIVHWPSGPVACCDKHGRELVAMSSFLGSHVGVTNAEEGDQCANCLGESERIMEGKL